IVTSNKLEVVAVNDLTDVATLAHLLKYDSSHGIFDSDIQIHENNLVVNGKTIAVFAEKDPENLPWQKLDVDMVLECTGKFVDEEGSAKHLKAGAKKVQISAPPKGQIPTVVLGVNHQILTPNVK